MSIPTAALYLFYKHTELPASCSCRSLSLYFLPFRIMIHHFNHFLANALNSFAILAVPLHILCKTSNQYQCVSLPCCSLSAMGEYTYSN